MGGSPESPTSEGRFAMDGRDDEPLPAWAERRRRRRAGRFRVLTLTPTGPVQGAHVEPDAPRLVARWNGYEWEAVCVAAGLAEAQRILYPRAAGRDPAQGAGRRPAPRPAAGGAPDPAA
jgi:hypothetical protein